MEDFATATSEVLVGLGKVAGKLKEITNVPGIDGSFLRNIPGIGAVLRATEALRGAGRQQVDTGGQERTAGRVNAQQRKQEERAIKNSVALRKTENDLLKKKTAVDQLKDKFDVERIGLTVALNEATALRAFVRTTLDSIEPQMNALRMLIGLNEQNLQNKKTFVSPTTPLAPAIPALPASYFQDLGTRLEGSPNYAGMSAAEISMERLRESGNRPVNLTLTVDTANSGDRFSQLIAESIQLASRSGYGTTPAGSLP
jgi:hypothetical protein